MIRWLPQWPSRRGPAGTLDVHVVLDHRWLLRQRLFHFHFTPTWFSALTIKKLKRSAHRSVKELAAGARRLAWRAAVPIM